MIRRLRSEAGFTYIEVLIAVVILGLSAASSSYALVNSRRASVDSRPFDAAQYLVQDGRVWAQSLRRIEPVDSPAIGPESGETRSSFDDVDDLAGFTESPVIDLTASAHPGFSRAFELDFVDITNPTQVVAPGTTKLMRLTIVVSRNGAELARESLLFWRQRAP